MTEFPPNPAEDIETITRRAHRERSIYIGAAIRVVLSVAADASRAVIRYERNAMTDRRSRATSASA